jgi:hypothetical protein
VTRQHYTAMVPISKLYFVQWILKMFNCWKNCASCMIWGCAVLGTRLHISFLCINGDI